MNMASYEQDLVALIQGELDEARAEELRRAMEADPELKAAYDGYLAACQAIRQVAPCEPSGAFRHNLAARIREASARPASRRRQALSRRGAEWPVRPLFLLISIAAAAVFLLAANFLVIYFPNFKSPREPRTSTAQITDFRQKLYEQRRAAKRQDVEIAGDQLSVAFLFGETNPKDANAAHTTDKLILVGHHFDHTDERCIMAFTPAQWESYQRGGERELSDFERMHRRRAAQKKQEADVMGGRVTIPPELLADYIGGSASLRRVSVIRLAGRAEIWARDKFDSYLQDPRLFISVPTKLDARLTTGARRHING